MKDQLSAIEKIELVRLIYSQLNLLLEDGALAGIVLTENTYVQFRRELSAAAIPHRPSGLDLDPSMEHTFVVDGLLVMKGTQLQ